jgi:hypothetical protein
VLAVRDRFAGAWAPRSERHIKRNPGLRLGLNLHWSIDVNILRKVDNAAACVVDRAQRCRKKAA